MSCRASEPAGRLAQCCVSDAPEQDGEGVFELEAVVGFAALRVGELVQERAGELGAAGELVATDDDAAVFLVEDA